MANSTVIAMAEEVVLAEAVPETIARRIPAPIAAELVTAELVDAGLVGDSRKPMIGLHLRLWRFFTSALEWFFGVAALIAALSVLASVPVLQFLSLGYMLEVSGRVARAGRIRDGFIGVRKAARLGGAAFGVFVVLAPWRFIVAPLAEAANLIEPGGTADRVWGTVLTLGLIAAYVHMAGAFWSGGRIRDFLWPRPIRLARSIFAPGAFAARRDRLWDFVVGLRMPYYFWFGFRGFLGGLLWLAPPITLLALLPQAPVVGVLGWFLLVAALLYVPFVQTRFAATGRFASFWRVSETRVWFRRAPIAFSISLLCTLLFALPLYLLKIEIVPREAAWLPSLVFVTFIFPARLVAGWACGRGEHRERPRMWPSRQVARLGMLPIVAIYALIVYFTQYTSWHGVASLYEQHAFLLPAPFLGF